MTGPISFHRDRVRGGGGLAGAIVGPLLAVAVVTAISLLLYQDSGLTDIVLLFGINAVMVVGFQVFVGNTGIVSFGHIAFMALGAYAGGIAAIPIADKSIFLPDLPSFIGSWSVSIAPALVIGGLVAGAIGLLAGGALMRLSGAAASIATLGLLIIVNNVIAQATPITRGPQSIYGIPTNTTFFWVFASLAVAVALASWFKWSALGLRARAARDEPVAAESSGVPLVRSRLWAFALSAFITGIGGALYAQLLGGFSPASFYLPQLTVVISMAIIGGINSITGALTGAAVISVVNELLRRVEDGVNVVGVHIQLATGISAAVLGVALIAMLRWRPDGLLGAAELQVGPGTRKRPPGSTPLPDEGRQQPLSAPPPEATRLVGG
ncbi:branched-chain amino acid ABC transporter permease [Conexibacter sp. CPCC 206217]|uniref:branched-chain amino acid ABC transporter permease n=1 Tax=Conexibacter sp. CPCC 206217 TaxID=3064574 RepID=UPI002720E73C|nr:branched-chain amino acid ABC transporter permease [Conexibacter sp. CPCC 206217]MDO8209567.1 branched-chain amino acid ABC transporter permease [Conexibacter sp. CPCC 206217]